MVLAGAVLLAQASLTFSAPAAPASRLIPALGQRAGVPLSVAPALAREVLLVEAKGTTLKDTMARIAQATGGEWSAEGEGYRLGLPQKTDLRQRRAEAVDVAEGFLHNYRQIVRMNSPEAMAAAGSQPIAAILANLPPETVGGLRFKQRVVLSTSPTGMQLRLPVEALNGIDLRAGVVNGQGGPANAVGPIAVVQIVLQNAMRGDQLAASLIAADRQGRTVTQRAEWLYRGGMSVPTRESLPKLPQGAATIVASKEARDLAAALAPCIAATDRFYGMQDEEMGSSVGQMYSDADLNSPIPGKKHPELLRPEANDPLGLIAGPLFAGLADSQGQNLVVDIPDAAFAQAATFAARTSVAASDLVREAWYGMGLETLDEGGWIVVRPRAAAAARDGRLDRAALGKAMRTLAKDGSLSLEAQADYAAAQPILPPQATFEGTYFAAIDPSFGKRIAASCAGGERQTLRLYRALGAHEGKLVRTFASLPAVAREALTDIVFNSSANPLIVRRTVAPNGRSVVSSMGGYGTPNALTDERTFYWGEGVPRDAVLTVSETTSSSYYGLAPNGARPCLGQSGESYGIQTGAHGEVATSTSLPYLERYQQGTIRRVALTLAGPDGVQVTRNLQEDSIPAQAPAVAFDDLPKELKERIARNQEALQNMVREQQQRQRQATPLIRD